jgi:hypothetical protein
MRVNFLPVPEFPPSPSSPKEVGLAGTTLQGETEQPPLRRSDLGSQTWTGDYSVRPFKAPDPSKLRDLSRRHLSGEHRVDGKRYHLTLFFSKNRVGRIFVFPSSNRTVQGGRSEVRQMVGEA